MKSKVVFTFAAGAVAALLAACGGGGSGGDDTAATPTPPTTPTPSASLQVSGTAATGVALANATVEVKCAAGSATTTAAANGSYSVTIADGVLPCAVQAATTTQSLHSLVDVGTLDAASGVTIARANVTPVTEMIVAEAGAALPDDTFKGFKAGSLTPAEIQAAATAIVAALKDAGMNLGAIDPLKGNLVAGASAGQGDAHDQLLDALSAKVDRDALKVVVNQIAVAAQARSGAGLKNAMAAVSGGSLPGCSVAVSGPYRSLDMNGNLTTRSLDFKNMRMGTPGTADSLSLTADPADSCVFTASGTLAGASTTMKVVIGASGVGTFRAVDGSSTVGITGYLFPAQSHSYSTLRGTWSMLNNDLSAKEQIVGQITYGAENQVTSCAYDRNWTCVPQPLTPTATENSDGGLTLPVNSIETVTVYGYRAPNGALALFGGSNPASGASRTSVTMVASRLATLPVPEVGSVMASWGSDVSISGNLAMVATDPAPISYTVTEADPSGLVTRRGDLNGRTETLHYNQPIAGVRTRDAGSGFAALYQIPLTGLGVVVSINAVPFGPNSTLIYNIAVVK